MQTFVTLLLISIAAISQAQTTDSQPIKKVPMTLIWTAVEGATAYNVMISRTPHFHESRAFKVSKTRFPIEVEPTGQYYWNVVALDANDREISEKVVVAFQAKEKGRSSTQLTALDHPMERTRPISEDDSEAPASEVFAAGPITPLGFQVGLELEGGNFAFKQRHPALTDIDTDGLMFPSFGLSLKTPHFFERFYARFFLQQNIADFKSETVGITLNEGSFRWLSYGAQLYADFAVNQWTVSPYLSVLKMNSPFFTATGTALDIRDIEYVNGGVGVKAVYGEEDRKWRYGLDLSYVTKLSADSDDFSNLDADQGRIFTGELFASLTMTPVVSSQFYLKAQSMKFEESVTYNGVLSSGERSATYYGLGARLLFSF